MGRRAAVVGAVDGPRAGAPVHALRDRRRRRPATCCNEQIPALRARAAEPDGRYDLGCLYIGTNDVRGFDWDPFAYERGLRRGAGVPRARAASAR